MTEATQQPFLAYLQYRLRRDPGVVWEGFRETWADNRKFRWLVRIGLALLILALALWIALMRNLPDAKTLVTYQPQLPTMVRGIDGEVVYSYARDRRVQLQFEDFPEEVTNAFLAAEDETFWSHGGVDITGTLNAVFDYARKAGSDQRAVGGSTITQQVAKNILLGDEYSVTRKLREMVLAQRIEEVLTKQEILELYLNEIPLGRRSFGVQAAARAYFDKDLDDLELHEAAFLAILPKAPERYGRARYEDMALARRATVLDRMERNGWATAAEVAAAKAKPLGLVAGGTNIRTADAGYYLEEVRRLLIEEYGEQAEDGPNSVYAGGLWVRTALDTEVQDAARDSLRAGLMRYQGGRGFSSPVATLNPDNGDLVSQLASSNLGVNYKDWRVGVITEGGSAPRIAFANGDAGALTRAPSSLKPGDVVAATRQGESRFRLEVVPSVSGGLLVQQPQTGRIVAMQGGFDARLGSFNRATQAERQPGSTIKPFVYATALDNGMTPATMVDDKAFCVWQGAALGEKCFRNYSRSGGGSHTMRWGLEQSRNLMTVHIADEVGMEKVTGTFQRLGIGTYDPYYSFALGAGETTVERMVNAYSALANNGVQYDASPIDLVQDRKGKVIWRADKRRCDGCNMAEWDGKPMPRLAPRGRQVMNPATAYQTVHMLRGVVQRGTALALASLDIPLFGKTGTTNGPTDVWFVGGSQDLVAGVYIGFDNPRNLGGYVQGGTFAAPIVRQLISETKPRWGNQPFVAPDGVRMIRIDRLSGKRVFAGTPSEERRASVIWEAFKADTEPPRRGDADVFDSRRKAIIAAVRAARNPPRRTEAPQEEQVVEGDFAEEQGGIY
ncbi:penicillin-binding protein 1A [Pseudoblastomonas halimionae]|uniref:Penicillin-binding protein n=1 Tax=Alteriqipengyuania halimionae TaxID=1926630 RepID=A0A6I4U042_9SPHN|nr:transglycosylase domain-containing protein [Alteriqipengyuania halimionae]MXP09238.1 penicillin-binding protein [Alteriqipengyuania halimionae]